MIHPSFFIKPRPTNSSSNNSLNSIRGGRERQEGAALSLIILLISLVRLAKLPFHRRGGSLNPVMSTKSLLPSYQDQVVSSVGSRNGRHRDHHSEKAHYQHHHHSSPSRRKKNRCFCLPRLRSVLLFLATLFFIFYVTDCLHLYKRISLKKEHGATHLQTTTWNFRFSRGPIDFSMGTFRSRDFVEINYPDAPS